MARPRSKKSQAHGQQKSDAQSTSKNAPLIATTRRPTDDTQNKQMENDEDSVEAVEDANSIPEVFMARRKARSSHIWLPENGIECTINGVVRWKGQRCMVTFDLKEPVQEG